MIEAIGWGARREAATLYGSNTCKRGASQAKATEVLLINGPSYTAPAEQSALFGS
jgi:hypothetical protein